jgi:putative transposase
MEAAADELAPLVGRAGACAAVGLSRAGWYRRHPQGPLPPRSPVAAGPPRPQPRALSPAERDELNAVLHEERFVDLAPAEVYATLLDEGRYLGSISTMYRELHRRHGGVPERRRQATHPAHTRPELQARRPNELWSWDVSKLRGPGKWDWFFLYWILDVYSRYAVGWCVTQRETAAISERLITDTIATHGVDATALTIHADRGAQQTAKPVAQLYADLGITRSHSRPRVSNDNPYSEAAFKTFKYRPDFPKSFDSLDAAVTHSTAFFDWSTSPTTTGASRCSPRPRSTTARPTPSSLTARPCSTPRMLRTPNASSTSHPPPAGHQTKHGSTDPTRRTTQHTETQRTCPKNLDTFRPALTAPRHADGARAERARASGEIVLPAPAPTP